VNRKDLRTFHLFEEIGIVKMKEGGREEDFHVGG